MENMKKSPRTTAWLKSEKIEHSTMTTTGNRTDTVGSLLRDMAENTSLHGIGQIVSARFRYQRMIWLILVLAFAGYLTFQLINLFSDFQKHPIQTSVALQFSKLKFPAVSFCNMNAVRKSKLNEGSNTLQQLVNISSVSYVDISSGGSGTAVYNGNGTNSTSCGITSDCWYESYASTVYTETSEANPEDYGWVPITDMEETLREEERFTTVYLNESRERRQKIGHSINDMLISCSFNGRKCYPENFTMFTTTAYGNCFTLSSKDFVSWKTGPSSGLMMVLNVESKEYLLDDVYGVRLVIHEHGSHPFPVEEGITLDTAFETDIGLRMIQLYRLGKPYGKCESNEKFQNLFGIHYTRTACIKLCKSQLVIDNCGCLPRETLDFLQIKNEDLPYCDTFSMKDVVCEALVTEQYSENEEHCKCENPCKQIQFQRTISGRQWPNKRTPSKTLMEMYCKKNLSYTLEECDEYTNLGQKGYTQWNSTYTNFLRVLIYYEDLNYELISEEPLYSVYRFISDIGGTMGLFIGASLVTIVELLQLLLGLINLFSRKFICRTRKEKVSNLQKLSSD